MRPLVLALLLVTSSAWSAAETTPASPAAAPETTAADREYAATRALFGEEAPADTKHPSPEFFLWQDRKFQHYAAAARAFGANHPQDPRRYDGWVQSSYTGPSFITGFQPGFAERPSWSNVISDEAAVLDYRREQVRLLTLVVEAPDATPRQRAGAFNALLIDSGTVARLSGGKFDVTTLRPLVDRLVARFPDERVLPVLEMYGARLRAQSPEAAARFEADLAAIPSLASLVAAQKTRREAAAAAKADKLAALATLKFTAVDGRAVDLAQLKGKVVLVDFWATWCGPCIAELPNVKKVYAAYHAQGFEIVGITLERAGVTAEDSPEQAVRKHAAAKKKLLDFTTKNAMPWPQHYDGLHFANAFAVQFGIDSIPAMFLLDQNGKVVATEARGEKLETEVKRLLGL